MAFIDVGLRGRMDGYAVVRALHQPRNGKRPLLVVITGSAEESLRERSWREGVDLHLTKPVEPADLCGILERFSQILAPPDQEGTS